MFTQVYCSLFLCTRSSGWILFQLHVGGLNNPLKVLLLLASKYKVTNLTDLSISLTTRCGCGDYFKNCNIGFNPGKRTVEARTDPFSLPSKTTKGCTSDLAFGGRLVAVAHKYVRTYVHCRFRSEWKFEKEIPTRLLPCAYTPASFLQTQSDSVGICSTEWSGYSLDLTQTKPIHCCCEEHEMKIQTFFSKTNI